LPSRRSARRLIESSSTLSFVLAREALVLLESAMAKTADSTPEVRPRLRISCGKEIALGPGKIELLEALQKTGSITAAAQQLGMSYMRAWTLIRTMNRCFRKPLVIAVRGGSRGGGGAELTDTGTQVLALYRQMNARCMAAMNPGWERLRRLLVRG
jgi:molybdate transport system regulatory protein